MNTFKSILTIILILAICSVYGQSELPKFAPSPDKVKVKLDMPLEGRKYKNGTGYSVNPAMLSKLPERVALVTFYTFDPGFTRSYTTSSTSGNVKTTTTTVKTRNSGGNSGTLCLGFYLEGVPVLKEKFAEMGMELLEPEEFLDTEEKKSFYAKFEIERSNLNKFLENALNSGTDHNSIYGYLDGYEVVSIDNEPFGNYEKKGLFPVYKSEISDSQMWVMAKIGKEVTSINTLTEILGVDAVVFFYSTIYMPKDNEIHLQNVNMLMFGPNPVPLEEGKDSKFNYFPGQMYVGTRANVGVAIVNENKKKPETQVLNFEGYSNIVEAMTMEMKAYFDKTME